MARRLRCRGSRRSGRLTGAVPEVTVVRVTAKGRVLLALETSGAPRSAARTCAGRNRKMRSPGAEGRNGRTKSQSAEPLATERAAGTT